MSAPPIPDNINTGQGVDGFGIGYFSRHIPLSKGGGASAYAPYPAPSGYRWDFVTYNGARVTYNAEPVVALIGA